MEAFDPEPDKAGPGEVKARLCDDAGAGPEDPLLAPAPAAGVVAIEAATDDGFRSPFLGYTKFEME